MSVTLPPELAQLLHEAGGRWPEADEDRLHELANGWRQVGKRLRTLQSESAGVAQAVAGAHRGKSIDAFSAQWSKVEHRIVLGAVAAEQTAVVVDAMAQATLTTKSAIVDVLAAGHTQQQQIGQQAAGAAVIGPLIRALIKALTPVLRTLFARLSALIRSAFTAVWNFIKRAWQDIAQFLADLFGPAPPPPPPLPPPPPVYKRDAPLPHARELIKNGTEWTATGRGGGKLPKMGAPPNSVLYRRNAHTGRITSYAVYDEQGLIITRVDLEGNSHGTVETPHTQRYKLNISPNGRAWPGEDGDVRKATPEEIP